MSKYPATATASRWRRSARRSASSCCSPWKAYRLLRAHANAKRIATPGASIGWRQGRRREDSIAGRARASSATVELVLAERGMDDFDATGAGRAIAAFVDELSNWYVRRSRRRFWDGSPAAFATLHRLPGYRRHSCSRRSAVHRGRDLRQPRRRRAVCICATSPAPGERDAELERVDGGRAGDRAPRAGRAQPGASSRSASRCAPRSSSPPAASATRSSGWPRSCAMSSTCASCASSRRPTSSARSRSSPTTARSAAFRQADAAGRRRGCGPRRRRAAAALREARS